MIAKILRELSLSDTESLVYMSLTYPTGIIHRYVAVATHIPHRPVDYRAAEHVTEDTVGHVWMSRSMFAGRRADTIIVPSKAVVLESKRITIEKETTE